MRIVGFHVDGFGLLHDVEVDGVGPGTTVVLGPNESGKSTLHAFLARTLFGHPRRDDARDRQRFEPLRGGGHGGSVHVEDDDGGRWAVHRRLDRPPALRVVGPDGREHGTRAALDPLLGVGTDLDRFEQVWAIDLDALTGLAQLAGPALQDLLFDAATVGAGRSLRGAAAAAAATRDALWTPSSTARPLAVALRERDEAREQLRRARAAAAGVVEVRTARDRAARRIDQLGDERADLLTEEALLDRVVAAWPHARALAAAEAELVGLPDEALPAGVVDRARVAAAAVEEAAAEVARATEELDALGAAASDRVLDPAVAAVAEEAVALQARTGAHLDEVQRLRRVEGAAAEAAAARDRALAEVGRGWDEARVLAVPVDAATREELRLLVGRLDELHRERAARTRQRDELLAVAARRRQVLERRREERREAPSPAEVRRAEEAVAVLRGRVPMLEQAALLRRSGITGAAPGMLRLLPRWLGWALLVAAAFLASLATQVVDGGLSATVFVVVVLAVCIPLGLVVGRVGSRRLAAWRDEVTGDVGDLAVDSALARGIDDEVRDAAVLLGLDVPPTLADVERVAGRVAAGRTALDHAERTDAELAVLAAELEVEQRAAADAAAAAERVERLLSESRVAWADRCAELGLDGEEEPRVTLVRHERVVTAAGAVRAAAQLREEAASRATVVDGFLERVDELLRVAGRRDVGDPLAELERLATAARDDARRQAAVATVRGRVAELERARDRAATRRDRAAAERDAALRTVGVHDRAGLDRLAALDARRTEQVARRDGAAARLGALLGSGEAATAARTVLTEADPIAWEARRAEVATRLAVVESDRDELVREHARLSARIEELGGDDAVPVAAQRLAAAQATVDRHAREWVVADGAARILDEAVATFERDQHPRVLVEAGRLLGAATLGVWTTLRQVDRVLVATRADADEPVAVDLLSRGTQEQVYLCLRLALAADRTRVEGRSLPLLVDDLLGTTDPARGAAVARVLAGVARQQQVWVFTCDPRVADLVVAVDGAAGVLELDRGGTVAGWRSSHGAGTPSAPPSPPASPPTPPPPGRPPSSPRG